MEYFRFWYPSNNALTANPKPGGSICSTFSLPKNEQLKADSIQLPFGILATAA